MAERPVGSRLHGRGAPSCPTCTRNTWISTRLIGDEIDTFNVESKRGDPHLLLNLYRSLIALRRSGPVLQAGSYEPLGHLGEALVYRRRLGDGTFLVTLNFGHAPENVPMSRSGTTSLSTPISIVRMKRSSTPYGYVPTRALLWSVVGPRRFRGLDNLVTNALRTRCRGYPDPSLVVVFQVRRSAASEFDRKLYGCHVCWKGTRRSQECISGTCENSVRYLRPSSVWKQRPHETVPCTPLRHHCRDRCHGAAGTDDLRHDSRSSEESRGLPRRGRAAHRTWNLRPLCSRCELLRGGRST
ncbi:DUF3459 domain-containing protein [Microvirga massiliensis]|uniref:DUF3459 domain-containing protein n=1 Tax=Microvirga massiliensis TaxID=1033741 RepID=UPI0009E62F77